MKELTPFIPFAMCSRKLREGEWKENCARKIWTQITTNVVAVSYIISSLAMGSFDFREWPDIYQQRQIQAEINERKYFLKNLDKDGSGQLSFEEFYNRK